MKFTAKQKEQLKQELVSHLISEKEIRKIIIFGSFLHSNNPNDIDIAIFQNSTENYLTLALKYRKKIRSVSKKIPVDVLPLKTDIKDNPFLAEIESGELIYER